MIQLYVSHLRRAIEGDGAAIVTHGRGYALELPATGSTPSASSGSWRRRRPGEALALWNDAPLADLRDEPFAAAEIRRLEELRARALESAIDAELAAGRHREVLGRIDALVAEHPLRERLHAQRMLALYPPAARRGARRLPRGADARRGDRRGARRRAAAAARADPRPGPGARACGRRRRTAPGRPADIAGGSRSSP